MRQSSTYIYLAVLVGLFCYVAFISKKVPGTKAQEEADTQLFQLNPDDVTAVEITNEHGFFFLQKVNGHWEIKKPIDTLADGATVDGIINQIAFTQPQRLPLPVDSSSDKDIANLKEWGLTPPAERVVIHTKDKHYELLIGRKVAVNDSVYSRASGKKNEPVRIIPSPVKDLLEKDLSAFRSRDVFSFDPAKATKIAARAVGTSTMPGQQYEVDRKDGTWTLQLPLVARASDSVVGALLGRILGAKAVDFVTDDASNLTSYGLTSPSATLSVTVKPDPAKPEEETVLQIGSSVPNKPDQVYAQRSKSSSVFTLTKSTMDDIFKEVPNVRDLHIFPFDPARVTHLSYNFGPKKADVRSDHAIWNCVGLADGPADAGKVSDLLLKLAALQTTPLLKDSATDLKPYGLDKPAGKITIESPEFKPGPSVTLSIGKAENKLLYVRNSAEPFVYTVPDNAFDFLLASNLNLRDLRVVNLKNDQVKSMTITAASSPPITLLRTSGGTWSASNVKDRMVDGLRADTQAALFCQLQTKAWLGPAQPAYELGKPVLSIAVLADQPNPTILHIGAPLPDGTHAAQVEGNPIAFALSDGDYGILNASSLQLIPKVLPTTNAPSAASPTPTTNAAVGAR